MSVADGKERQGRSTAEFSAYSPNRYRSAEINSNSIKQTGIIMDSSFCAFFSLLRQRRQSITRQKIAIKALDLIATCYLFFTDFKLHLDLFQLTSDLDLFLLTSDLTLACFDWHETWVGPFSAGYMFDLDLPNTLKTVPLLVHTRYTHYEHISSLSPAITKINKQTSKWVTIKRN